MKRFLAQFQRGWKQNGWQTTFAITLLPATLLAGSLAWNLPRQADGSPAVTATLLLALAILGSLIWAGLKEGPRGRLGFPIWCVALGFGGVAIFAHMICLPIGKHSVRFFVGGHGFTIDAVPDYVPQQSRVPQPLSYTQNTKWA